ncbi:MAG TPA: M20/M25/M40 family metallo-hydrolase [Longimicrobiales bacterium]|nr:M20/M25/M40 family metallo-hydrolase [Longimicrobiales bacterium]
MNVRASLALLALAAAACRAPAVPPGAATGQEESGAVSEARGRATRAGSPAAAAAEQITADGIRAHIAYLASDELKGRDTPSPGLEMAAAYIAREFERYGLEPAGDSDGYLQRYPLMRRAVRTEGVTLRVSGPGGERAFAFGREYFVAPGGAESAGGALVYGGDVERLDSGAAATARGAVLVLELPGARPQDWRPVALRGRRIAQEVGAAAVVFIMDAGVSEALIREEATATARSVAASQRPPAAYLSAGAGRELVRVAGRDLDSLRAARAPVALQGASASLTVPVVEENEYAPNVVGLLRGSDPELRDTYVIFSAHMDHVGVGRPDAAGDSIYNGADDNASGTAALLQVARAFASLAQPPARSVVFLAVSGEEKGLLGSRHYSDNPTVPLEGIVANINIDMIGRNSPDSVVAIGQEFSSLGLLVQEIAAEHPELGLTVAPDLWPEERFFFRSDHFNFARKEIPAIFFFAGVHEDYHRPSDHAELIDTDKAARVSRLVFYLGYEIATRREPPQWTEEGLAQVRAMTR